MFLGQPPIHSGTPITLDITPRQAFAPATFRASIRIERSAENRELWLLWEGTESGRKGLESLDGNSPVQYVWTDLLKNLPAGEYTAQAFLIRSTSVHQSAPIPFVSLGAAQ